MNPLLQRHVCLLPMFDTIHFRRAIYSLSLISFLQLQPNLLHLLLWIIQTSSWEHLILPQVKYRPKKTRKKTILSIDVTWLFLSIHWLWLFTHFICKIHCFSHSTVVDLLFKLTLNLRNKWLICAGCCVSFCIPCYLLCHSTNTMLGFRFMVIFHFACANGKRKYTREMEGGSVVSGSSVII